MQRHTGRITYDRLFKIGLWLKAIDGAFELIGGVLLLIIRPHQINYTIRFFTVHDFSRDPDDAVTSHLIKLAHQFDERTIILVATYLIVDALIKLVLIYEVLHHRYWAYLMLIVVLSALIVYQVYRISYSHSVLLTLLTIFDALIVYLTLKEYQRHRRHPAPPASPNT